MLWNRLRAGDRQALGELYTLYFAQLFQYCMHFTKDRNLVKDVLQDFFVTLFKNHARLGPVHQVKSYLMVAARREMVRRLNKKEILSLAKEEEDYQFLLELSTEQEFIHKQYDAYLSKQLQQMVNQLSPRQKEAIYLYFFENASYDTIAEIMSFKDVKYTRALIYRALAQLKQALKNPSHFLETMVK